MGEAIRRTRFLHDAACMDHPDGEWVYYDDHEAEIATLRAEIEVFKELLLDAHGEGECLCYYTLKADRPNPQTCLQCRIDAALTKGGW